MRIAGLVFLLSLPLAAAAQPELRGARLESAKPSTVSTGRYSLRARLEPAPPNTVRGNARAMTLRAVLRPEDKASCPVPGSLFANGFES